MILNRADINVFFRLFLFAVLIIVLGYANAYSQPMHSKTSYCTENKLGWKFYCDDGVEEQKKEQKPKNKKQEAKQQEYKYTQELTQFQKMFEEVKARAVLYPTEENVKAYMFLQMMVFNQASLFNDTWQKNLRSTPELDYLQKNPASAVGREVLEKDRYEKMISNLKNINRRYGIFFVYSTKCKYCIKYSEILYDFKQRYNIEIRGISTDGNFFPNWENVSFVNRGQLEQLGVNYSATPLTILFDMEQNTVIPVGYGLMTQDEIMERIYKITQEEGN